MSVSRSYTGSSNGGTQYMPASQLQPPHHRASSMVVVGHGNPQGFYRDDRGAYDHARLYPAYAPPPPADRGNRYLPVPGGPPSSASVSPRIPAGQPHSMSGQKSPSRRISPPPTTKWVPLPQTSKDRVSVQEARLMSAAAKAAAVKAASIAVASMVKRLGRSAKRAVSNSSAANGCGVQAKRIRSTAATEEMGDEASRSSVQPAANSKNRSASGVPVPVAVGPMTCVNCGTTKTPLWRRDPRGQPICNACGLYFKSYGKMRPLSLKRAQRHADAMIGSSDCGEGGGSCPGDGTCNGKGGGPSCDGCPAYNQKHLPHTTRTVASHAPQRRLTAAERAAAIANGAATDELGNIVGPLPDSAIGPGRVPPSVAAAIADSLSAEPSDEISAERAVCFNCGTDYTPLWRRDSDGHIACNACGLYYKLHGKHRPISMKRTTIKRRRRGINQVTSQSPSAEVDLESLPNSSPSPPPATENCVSGLQSLVEAAASQQSPQISDLVEELPTDQAQVQKCREELQRECARLQALLERSTSLLEKLNKNGG